MSSRPPSLLPQLPSSTVARPPGIGGSSANPQPPLSPLQPLSNNNNVSRRASSRPIPGGGEVSSLPPPTSSFDLLTSKDPPTTATSPLTPRMIGGGGGGGAGGMRSTAGSRTSSSSRLLQSTTSAAVSDGTSRDGDVGSRSAVVAAASGTMTPNSPLGGIRTGMRAPISRTSSSGQVLSPIGSGATSVTSSAGDTFVTAPPPLLPLLGQQSPPPVSPSSRKSPLASMMPLDGGPVRPRSPPSSSASSASESESPRSSSRYSSAARSRSPSGNTTTAITSAASGGRYGRASPLQAIAILPRGSLVTDDPGSVSGIETDGEGGDDGEQDPVPEGNVLMHAMVAAKNLIQYGGGKQTMSVNDEIRELQHLSHIRLDRLGLVAVEYLSTTLTHITNLYLQHNSLTTAAGLAPLRSLRFLALGHNHLSDISDLRSLTSLVLLDVSHNALAAPLSRHAQHFPSSLVFIDLSHNPAALADQRAAVEAAVTAACPNVAEINGVPVTTSGGGGLDDEAEHDRVDDDDDLLAYAAYAYAGPRSIGPAGSVTQLARHGDAPLDLSDDKAGDDGRPPDVLRIAAFPHPVVADAYGRAVGVALATHGGGKRAASARTKLAGQPSAEQEYARRVREIKERYGYAVAK